MTEQEKRSIRPFGLRDKVGYMFGDIGNNFTFAFASSFLMMFYNKVLGISGTMVGTLFLTARIVDAFTDVTMGRIVDSMKPTKHGRFRVWLKWMSAPVAIASFLMYQSAMAEAPMAFRIFYMYVTYLLWGSIFYTSINIPYGSMASSITSDPNERTSLSTFRNIGASLSGLVIGVVTPLLIYVTDADGHQVLRSGATFTWIAGVFSILAVVCYLICYHMTTERVQMELDPNKKTLTLAETFRTIFQSRALLGIIGAAIFLMLSQLLINSMNNYLYPEYFKNAGGISLYTLLTTFYILAVIAPVSVRLSRQFGKKEAASVGMFITGAVYLLMYVLHIKNMWVFLLLTLLGYFGQGYFNTIIWANITDVIDEQEVLNGAREDGTVYAVYSFARKVGQALAGGIGGWALDLIGYQQTQRVQTAAVLEGLYTTSTLVPAIGFLIVAFFLWFIYPLGKQRVQANVEELKRRHGNGEKVWK